MYRLLFTSEAYEDIKCAYDWYESQRQGLGEDFLMLLEASCVEITGAPMQLRELYRSVRRKLMWRFPYGIFYRLKDSTVVVLAVLHTKRDPKSWKKRI